MSNVYDQHVKAFSQVSAYVILNDKGRKVATIAFKFPKDGAGRLYAYVRWLGAQMQRGFASGCGYDKQSAAVRNACDKIEWPINLEVYGAIKSNRGESWVRALENAGFRVVQAV